jgi:hypothetical protein
MNPHIRQCPDCGENCLQCVGTYTEWWEDVEYHTQQDQKIVVEESEDETDK